MEEKHALRRFSAPPPRRPALRRRRFLPVALISALGLFYYLAAKPSVSEYARTKLLAGSFESFTTQKSFSAQELQALANIPLETPTPKTATEHIQSPHVGPVDLEAHIMSQCPDAQDCIQQMIIPAMEQVAPLVNFTLSFIGTVADDGSDAVVCKHGPVECLGNMLMLCADSLYPDVPIISLGFSNCLISDYAKLSERDFVQNCALQHAVDFQRLNECVSDDAKGLEMLRKSVRWSQKEGIVYSCTVRVNGQNWCVRDDGEWKDCPDGSEPGVLVEKIKTLANAK